MGGMVPASKVEEIRQASDIATVIGSYFNLQRRGATFKALCPFHQEKTPSFIVNQQRQIFHCFGCGAGGDVFRFVMDYEKVDFGVAVRMLAQRAGIRLAFEDRKRKDTPDKEDLYEILAKAAAMYHQFLMKNTEAGPARAYLKSRALTRREAEDFQIGFAPDRWDTLLSWAKGKYGFKHLEAAGLIIASRSESDHALNKPHGSSIGKRDSMEKANNYYDRFRNRVMFPIHDELGRVVGFSARVINGAESGAKYINTPETALFRKGRILYGLQRARREIARSREAIVCEGQIDVIRCHQAGFNIAVAPQGTAFTDEHARIINRYADSVLLAFDADQAGRDAVLRAADILLQAGIAARIVKLPPGEDPDAIIKQKDGRQAFQSFLENAVSALDFFIDMLTEREKMNTEAGMLRVVSEILDMISKTPDSVQHDILLRQAAERLGLSEISLKKELQKKQAGLKPPAKRSKETSRRMEPLPIKEAALATHVVIETSLAGLVEKYLPLDLITSSVCRRVIESAIESFENGEDVLNIICKHDTESRELSGFVARSVAEPTRSGGRLATNEESVKSLILGIRTDALRKCGKELEQAQLAAKREGGSGCKREHDLVIERSQLGYDIAKLKKWDTAIPLMESMS